jgi:Protein of unknown function (DUF3822)
LPVKSKIVQASFSIHTEQQDDDAAQLLVSIGPAAVSFITSNPNNKSVYDIVVYLFGNAADSRFSAQNLKAICTNENILKKRYSKTHIVYGFDESIIVPKEVYDKSSSANMMADFFGDSILWKICTDFMYRHNLYNVYALPPDVFDAAEAQFPFTNTTHQNSLLPDIFTANGLHLIFYPHSFTLFLKNQGKLQVMKTFVFSAADDVAYHVLNTCTQFGTDVNATTVFLYGMIDKKSGLFSELYKYFPALEFSVPPPGYQLPVDSADYPHHYFSHLIHMSICV